MPNFARVTPTLLVGVGGIGCWLADRVYALAREAGITDSRRVKILGFDTDRNDLGKLGHLGRDQLVQTSTADTVFTLMTRYRERIEDWFVDEDQLVTEIRQMNLLVGAGQFRMLSRMAFDAAMQDVNRSVQLDNAILSIATHDNASAFQGQVNVFIIGSLAGGTGSGMFLQTALLLAAKLRARGMVPQVRGFFVLPDVLALAARLPVKQIHRVRANGYAALKELNAIGMQTRSRSDRDLSFRYVGEEGLQTDAVPFTSLVLMDFENQSGGNLGPRLESYTELAAKAAYTLLFTPIGNRYDSIAVNDVPSRLEVATQGGDNSIAGIGLTSIVYPQDEIVDYLAARYGQSMLEGSWLRLDAIFQADLERYHARLASGETNLAKPRRGESYVRNLEQLAQQERVRFFRDIYEAVYLRTDEGGNERLSVQFETYLDSLEGHIVRGFWESSPKLRKALRREDLAADALADKHALAEDVRHYEADLRTDVEEINRALSSVVHDLFHNSVVDARYLGEPEWKDHHLEAYVLRGGPHLVQVRYFLYKLRDLIAERVKRLEDETHRIAIESTLKESFDDPSTKPIETALDIAVKRAESAIPEALDKRFGELRKFVRQYRDYYNSVLAMARRLGEDGTKRQLYQLLDQYAQRMLVVIERFFDDLGDLKDELKMECNKLEAAHAGTAGLTAGSRYVFADRAAKQQLWSELSKRIGGSTEGPARENAALTGALIERFREESRAESWEIAPFSGNDLFRKEMVGGFCRKAIEGSYRDIYRRDAIDAMRREARLAGRDPDELIGEIVALVASQSSPLVSLAEPTAGQDYRFWALSPETRARIGDDMRFQELFGNANGDQPLVEDEFPPHTLTCICVKTNLSLSDLRKLNPGLRAHTNISSPQRGIYFNAYRQLVESALAYESEYPARPNPYFTPHLDRDWHRPGVLPEMDPALEAAQNAHQAYVYGVALDLLPWEQRNGRPVALFRDSHKLGQPDWERELLGRHDDLPVIETLSATPDMVRSILDQMRALAVAPVGGAAGDPLYQGLTRVETLARICRLLEDRTRAAQADQVAAAALGALFRALREVHARRHPHLNDEVRLRELEQLARDMIGDAERLLGTELEADTLRHGIAMARGQLEKMLRAV